MKRCRKCGLEKDLEEFYKHATNKDGRQPYCKPCHKESCAKWNRDNDNARKWREGKGRKKYMLYNAKHRAKKNGVTVSITEDDFDIPEFCPVLGIPLTLPQQGTQSPSSASLDRIDPNLGYEPGNIQVISDLANRMKQNASPEQLLAFSEWVQTTYGGVA